MSTESEADSTVTLGSIEFDPVAANDFRLSIEGTSNTGKSNTDAVVLEDLAGVGLPTLVIERLGALTPVRHEDADLVVVGARQAEGIDLAVSLDDLERVGEWVLDRGMKLLVDVSTYADPTEERSRVHLAAAKALRSLNERAHAKYRAGDRTRSLLVGDEAHWLAPKDNASEPEEKGEYVRRCRGELIRAATEGGNLGISTVVSYQRRAFIHNGVIRLCQDWIAHGLEGDDAQRAAKSLQCEASTLLALDVGDIMARGRTITNGALVGPTDVRKRRSPDPREETFSLPDPDEDLAAILAELQKEVEADAEQRSEREAEIDQLRSERERLAERVDQLQEAREDDNRLARAMQQFFDMAESGEVSGSIAEEVQAPELVEQVEELRAERAELEKELSETSQALEEARAEHTEQREQIEQLEAELETLRDLESLRGDLVEQAESVLRRFGPDEFDPVTSEGTTDELDAVREDRDALQAEVNDLSETVEDLQAENEQLRERASVVSEDFTERVEFIRSDPVREQITAVAESADRSDEHFWKVVFYLADVDGPQTVDDVLPMIDAGKTTVRSVLSGLAEQNILTEHKQGRKKAYSLNIAGLEQIIEQQSRRDQIEDLRSDVL
jgi:peptidoglycan hydrolase CwlO-like protein